MVPDEYFKGGVHHQAVGEASPEEEGKSDGGKETESILGMCKGPVEGAWPMQGTGRQPGGGQCVLKCPGQVSRTSDFADCGAGLKEASSPH